MRKSAIVIIIGILLLSIFSVFSPIEICNAGGEIIYVNPGESIQDAIDAANASDIIYVYPGTYSENLDIPKSISIIGQYTSQKPIISSSSDDRIIEISSASDVTISGFEIMNNAGGAYQGIYIDSSDSCEITDCTVKTSGNSAAGIYVKANNCVISNCIIEENNAEGIYLLRGNNQINNNTIRNNRVGIRLSYSDSNSIYSNKITGSSSIGIQLLSSESNEFCLNDFTENQQQVAFQDSNPPANSWDKNNQGNYWDDYNDYDKNPKDDRGDSPHVLTDNGNNVDNYVLGYFLSGTPQAYIDSISPNPATEGETVSFNGRGTPDGMIIDWEWQSSIDGVLCEHSEDFSSSDLSVGTHTIKFRVKDDTQWSEYATATLTINAQGEEPGDQKPTATIVKPSTSATVTANQGESVEFQGYGTPSEGMILEYSWRSNKDGIIGTTSYFTKSSLSVGIHIIYFKVRDSNDWSDEVSSYLVILEDSGSNTTNNAPTANAGGPYNGYEGYTIVFDGSGSTDNTTITTYEWDFGDGETGTGYKLSHTYTTSGNYTVTLTVTDDSGLSDSNTTTAHITTQSSEPNGENNDDNNDTPGFEITIILIAITILLFSKKKK